MLAGTPRISGGGGSATIGGTIAATQFAYGNTLKTITGDANATRIVGTLTNISDIFTAGKTSAIQLSSNLLGYGIKGAGITQITPSGGGAVIAGDLTGLGGTDYSVALESIAGSGTFVASAFFAGTSGGGGLSSIAFQTATTIAAMNVSATVSELEFYNGTNTSGVQFGSNTFMIENAGNTWTWPITAGSLNQVLQIGLGSALRWATMNTGTVTGTGSPGQVSYWSGVASMITGDTDFTWDSANKAFNVGDLGGDTNGTTFTVSDSGQTTVARTKTFIVRTPAANDNWFSVTTTVNAQIIKAGDISSLANQTLLTVDDHNENIIAQTYGNFKVVTPAGKLWLNSDTANLTFSVGDLSAGSNSTTFILNDSTQSYTFSKGAISINTVAYTFPSSGGAANTTLINNGSGALSWQSTPIIQQKNRATAQTAVASLTAVTVGASDGSYRVSANVNVTSSTAFSFSVTCTYTDETNTSRVLTLNFSQLTGAFVTTLTNVLGAGVYEGVPLHIRCKAGTTITIASVGTFTTVTYNIEECIEQIA